MEKYILNINKNFTDIVVYMLIYEYGWIVTKNKHNYITINGKIGSISVNDDTLWNKNTPAIKNIITKYGYDGIWNLWKKRTQPYYKLKLFATLNNRLPYEVEDKNLYNHIKYVIESNDDIDKYKLLPGWNNQWKHLSEKYYRYYIKIKENKIDDELEYMYKRKLLPKFMLQMIATLKI